MVEVAVKPRLTRYDDVLLVVRELKRLGVSENHLHGRVTEVGPVDLDILNAVIANDRMAA